MDPFWISEAHAAATFGMCGVMWTVQLVIYPQFRRTSVSQISEYSAAHGRSMVTLLSLFAPTEIGLAAFWWWFSRGNLTSGTVTFINGGLLAAGWVGTALWYAPLHSRIANSTDSHQLRNLVDQLISTNWLRTGLWTIRAVTAIAAPWVLN